MLCGNSQAGDGQRPANARVLQYERAVSHTLTNMLGSRNGERHVIWQQIGLVVQSVGKPALKSQLE
jgi:hypothetical protein